MPCLLCASTADLVQVTLEPRRTPADEVTLCDGCRSHLDGAALRDAASAAFLRDTIWSTDEVTQALSWRMLSRCAGEAWATELLEQVWLEERLAAWAAAGLTSAAAGDDALLVRDSNGTPLIEGDAVTLIKDLEVKGAGFTAKRGTLVKAIHLTDDAGMVEGRVNGITIVLKTQFLKKA
jgi:protein PhnA